MKKNQSIAVTVLLFLLAGCTSSDDSNNINNNNTLDVGVSVNAGLVGLWEARTAGIPGVATNVSIPAGELYMFFDNLVRNNINFTAYTKSKTSNCLNRTGPDVLTLSKQDLFVDAGGNTLLLLIDAGQNNLSSTLNVNGSISLIGLTRTNGINVGDLQVCIPRLRRSDSPNTTSISEVFKAIQ